MPCEARQAALAFASKDQKHKDRDTEPARGCKCQVSRVGFEWPPMPNPAPAKLRVPIDKVHDGAKKQIHLLKLEGWLVVRNGCFDYLKATKS